MGWVIPNGYQVPVGVLAAALVHVAVSGEADQTLQNVDLRRIGQEMIAKK